MQETVAVTLTALTGPKENWRMPPDLVAQAHMVLDEKGLHDKSATTLRKPPPGRIFKLGLVYFAPEAGADVCMKGMFDGLAELGFGEGKSMVGWRWHASG